RWMVSTKAQLESGAQGKRTPSCRAHERSKPVRPAPESSTSHSESPLTVTRTLIRPSNNSKGIVVTAAVSPAILGTGRPALGAVAHARTDAATRTQLAYGIRVTRSPASG